MPSRKVISIFIISLAFVVSIILISEPKQFSGKVSGSLDGSLGILAKGPQVTTLENVDWQKEVGAFTGKNLSAEARASSTETLTDEFGRSFLANYLALKQSGNVDSTSVANLLDKSAQFVEKSATTKNLTLADIVISSDNSKTAITKYAKDLDYAFKSNEPTVARESEIDLFGQMMENNDESASLKLKNISSVYLNIADSLSRIRVPGSFALTHITLVNNMYSLSASVSMMSTGLDDPLKALSGLNIFVEKDEAIVSSMKKIGFDIVKAGGEL